MVIRILYRVGISTLELQTRNHTKTYVLTQVIPPLCFLINHYLCFVYVDCKFLWQGLSLVCVCVRVCVYPGQ